MTITTLTIGGLDYVSYASLAEANAALAVDPNRSTAWSLLTDEQKSSTLVAATYRVDMLNFAGSPTNGATQKNAFPISGLFYSDGSPVSTTEVPAAVERATILTAGSISVDPTAADSGTSGENIRLLVAGTAKIEYFRPEKGVPFQDATAYHLLVPFLASVGGTDPTSGTMGAMATGTGDSSYFDKSYSGFGRSGGFS